MRRLSATMAPAPPGPGSLVIVGNRGATGTGIFSMAEKGRAGCVQEQGCLSYRYQLVTTN